MSHLPSYATAVLVLTAALACGGDNPAPSPTPSKAQSATQPPSAGFSTPGGTWRTLAPIPTPRMGVAVAALNDKIYVIGGIEADGSPSAKVEVYDPTTDIWNEAAPLPQPRHHAAAIEFTPRVDETKLLVAGGFASGYEDPKSTVFEYDDLTNMWSDRSPLQTARGGLALTKFERFLVAVGGAGRTLDGQIMTLRSVEWMDFPSRTWRETDEPLAVARAHLAAATAMAFGGGGGYPMVFAVGGGSSVDGSSRLDVNEGAVRAEYWGPYSAMPTARSGIAAATFDLPGVGYQVYVFGGEGSEGTLDTVEVYNVAKICGRLPHPCPPLATASAPPSSETRFTS